ncbi:hypothetical protein [Pseudobdellovibrio sp. HCB154]|uniref:hypothetical protein n=1 Tax=Pseudobdellovibrio sp. HCB154 TaxID=3386277 RepID=UPI0039174AF6
MFLSQTKLKIAKKLMLATLAMSAVACDKGGGSFSVLSDNSQFKQNVTFTPRKLDVLFVVDNSGSMATSQQSLANNFPSFIDKFIDKGYDFRIAVTTTDAFYGDQFVSNGCSICNVEQTRFRSGVNPAVYVIDRADYDLAQAGEEARLKSDFTLNVKVGTSGSGDERAFSSFKAALSSSLNVGFHRPDAFLAVVIVSDEEDFSQSEYTMNESYSNPNLFSVASYKTFLDGFTGGVASQDYSVSAISISDQACRDQLAGGSGGAQKVAIRYNQLVDLTGGTKNSICNPFDQTLDNISSQIMTEQKPVYTLDKKPIIASIRVVVDGVVVPQSSTDGWSYDAVDNTITINGLTYKPGANSAISINFDPDLT